MKRRIFLSRSATTALLATIGGVPGFAGDEGGEGPDEEPLPRKPKKKGTECCIDASSIRRLKAAIQKEARRHNKFNKIFKDTRAGAQKAIKEIRALQKNFSGIGPGNDALLESVIGNFKDLISNRSVSAPIDRAGNILTEADIRCRQAEKSKSCKTRLARARRALDLLKQAQKKLDEAQVGFRASVILSMAEASDGIRALPSQIRSKLPVSRSLVRTGRVNSTTMRLTAKANVAAVRKQVLSGC